MKQIKAIPVARKMPRPSMTGPVYSEDQMMDMFEMRKTAPVMQVMGEDTVMDNIKVPGFNMTDS